MRLVHLADLHLGFRQYQRLTPGGINQREADVAQTASRAIRQIIELRPDAVVVGGDVFHSVRPPNPAILHAFRMFSSLREALPETPVIMVAGNHDAPRTTETGCILRLFRELGVHVADRTAERFPFRDQSLSVLAVPDVPGIERPALLPDPDFKYNVLLMHGEIAGVLPVHGASSDRAAIEIPVEDLHADQWNYVALGHYHVYHQVAPRAFYSGSIDYTSSNPWSELREERQLRLSGKGFIEHDLRTQRHQFHAILDPVRKLVDLDPLDAQGLGAKELDQAIAARVNQYDAEIGDSIVRLVVRNVPRHIARELDHAALRELRKRTLHFHLDTRKPDVSSPRTGEGAPGRRTTLRDLVAQRLRERVLPGDMDRDTLVGLGLRYLAEAEEASATVATVAD